MEKVERVGISLESELLCAFDKLIIDQSVSPLSPYANIKVIQKRHT
jgi:metal-responsive CopG/Arc/MetJ family transcriptional regulator